MKKGQVSVLIIIGLVLLLVTSIALFIIQQQRSTEITQELALPEETIVADKFTPIQNFVKECLRISLHEGIVQAGRHGGWVSVNDPSIIGTRNSRQLVNEMSNIRLGNPTESSRLVEDGYDIPYWSYNKRNNDLDGYDISFNLVPQLKRDLRYEQNIDLRISDYQDDHSIEAQLDRYLYKNLPTCLNNFEDFRAQGFNVRMLEDDFRPMVTIHDGIVLAYLDMPMEIDADKIVQRIDFFIEDLTVDLKGAYEIAYDVNRGQLNGYPFLADYSMQMIGQNSGLDRSMLPPIHATTINRGPISWSVRNVRDLFEDHLVYYSQLIQLDRTKNFIPEENALLIENPQTEVERDIVEFERADSFSRSFNLLYKDHSNLNANFYYLGWPTYFRVDPSMGNTVLTGETYDNEIAFNRISYTYYDFQYSYSYPMVLEIVDENAFEELTSGEGFVFTSAYEINVRYNDVETNNPFLIDLGIESDEEEPVITQICHEEQQINGPIDIYFHDSSNPLIQYENVEFLYSCDELSNGVSCNAQAEAPNQYFFSMCAGATIKVIDERFEPKTFQLGDIYFGDVKTFNFSINKMSEFNYDIKKRTKPFIEAILGDNGTLTNSGLIEESVKNIGSTEFATLSLERIPDHPYDPEVVEYIFLEGKNASLPDINLTPGWYKIDALLVSEWPVAYGPNYAKKNVDYSRVELTNEFIMDEEADGSILMEQIPLGVMDTVYEITPEVHLQDRFSTQFIIPALDRAPDNLQQMGEYRDLFYSTLDTNPFLVEPRVLRR